MARWNAFVASGSRDKTCRRAIVHVDAVRTDLGSPLVDRLGAVQSIIVLSCMKRTLDMLAVLLALFAAVHAVWAWAELREVAAWNEGVGVNQGVGAVSSGLAEVFVEFLILIPPITMTTLRRRQRQAAIAVHRWYAASTICLLLMSLVASPFGLLRVAAVVSLMGVQVAATMDPGGRTSEGSQ
jgi:hypothetical protein